MRNLCHAHNALSFDTRRIALVLCLAMSFSAGCLRSGVSSSRTPAETPAASLAFRFEPDVAADKLPSELRAGEDSPEAFQTQVEKDFKTRRTEENLLRTVVSPDGARVLALYETAESAEGEFQIDIYNANGELQRAILPRELSGGFPQKVAWSPNGEFIAFIALRSTAAKTDAAQALLQNQTLDNPLPETQNPVNPNSGAPPANNAMDATPKPLTVPAFSTEQIYVCDKEGFTIRPLTLRDGLVYFHFTWSPDSRALAALACKPNEFNEALAQNRFPSGRPRVVIINGGERLLDDRRASALPVWSPDASKIATAFETNGGIQVAIYDAAVAIPAPPTAAALNITQPLRTASVAYDKEHSLITAPNTANTNTGANINTNAPSSTSSPLAASTEPLSFNPVARLAWVDNATLYIETAYVRRFANTLQETKNFARWHVVRLSQKAPRAANRG